MSSHVRRIAAAAILAAALAAPQAAEAGPVAAAASAAAKHAYRHDTGRRALRWSSSCTLRPNVGWRCRSTARRGSYVGRYRITVDMAGAHVTARAYVR